MIFPNSQNIDVSQLLNSSSLPLPFGYNGGQINYRDSSWLKLYVCELFRRNECPNVDNCSLAHPPNNVKLENNKVTVCYDYIKKKDCKHNNCKYYHPHDALASAILKRGDDTKKNAGCLSNLGLSLGLPNPFQMPQSHDLFQLQTQNLISSQINNAVIANQQMKAKLEVMHQLNSGTAPQQAWLPSLNAANGQTLVSLANPVTVSLQSLIAGVSAKSPFLNQFGSLIPAAAASNTLLRPTIATVGDPADMRLAGIKRGAADMFGSISTNGHLSASNDDNNMYGLPDIKKEKMIDSSTDIVTGTGTDQVKTSHYYAPVSFTNVSDNHHIHQQNLQQMNVPIFNGATIPTNFNIMQTTPLQVPSLSAYHHLAPVNINQLLLQSLLANSQSIANQNLEAQMAMAGQKLYAQMSACPPLNVPQTPLANQLFYQQFLQHPLSGSQQILYPGTMNLNDVQPRAFEETNVALINDKGNMLETLPVCKDFLQGKCKRNISCNYVHLVDSNVEIKDSKLTVCKNAVKGQCHRAVCKFYHIPTYQLQRIGIHNNM